MLLLHQHWCRTPRPHKDLDHAANPAEKQPAKRKHLFPAKSVSLSRACAQPVQLLLQHKGRKVRAWKPAAGIGRRTGAAIPKIKCIYINAWLELRMWENINPPSQPSNTFSLKHQQPKESRISKAISSPLNGSITSK